VTIWQLGAFNSGMRIIDPRFSLAMIPLLRVIIARKWCDKTKEMKEIDLLHLAHKTGSICL
jgi:hypothetical protein